MAADTVAEPDDRIQELQFSRQPEPDVQDERLNGATQVNAAGYSPGQANGQATSTRNATKAPRVLGPDLLRGLLMVLQAIDHAAISSGAWGHGQGTSGEQDGQNVDTWISPIGWTARTLTHLCAPGFMFLLGMGVVYFGRSRAKLGWSTMAMVKHFFIRALVLAVVNTLLGLVIIPGRLVFMNIVLLALAINYFIAGLLWLALNGTEQALTRFLSTSGFVSKPDQDETRPLLANEEAPSPPKISNEARAARISFHLHNVLLAILTTFFVLLNSWMSPTNGHCLPTITPLDTDPTKLSPSGRGPWFDFWFYSVRTPNVFSGFPPLAWLSFAIFGLLYARLLLSTPSRSPRTITFLTFSAGLALLALFTATRLLHLGNLSESCLHMPEHIAHPHRNQYLASFRSFFYVVKYPPSPAYFALTMGANLLLLAGFAAIPEKTARRIPGLLVFGTCALFFYVLHLPLYGLLGAIAKRWVGRLDPRFPSPGTGEPGVGIGDGWAFWVVWVLGLAVLWPACRWYGGFKGRRGPDSVFRFF